MKLNNRYETSYYNNPYQSTFLLNFTRFTQKIWKKLIKKKLRFKILNYLQ